MAASPDLSLVIPVFNEVGNLRTLQERIGAALDPLAMPYEVIYVDDGSQDGSYELLESLAAKDPRVKGIRFRRNYGQTAAMAAGIEAASAPVIVALDADLQNDPADIPVLLSKMAEGFDVVSGWRQKRQDAAFTRKLPSLLANRLISRMTGVRLHDYGCTLKAYRAHLIKEVHLYGDMHRFLPAHAALQGARVAEVPVRHHARGAGKTKYGLGRTFRVLLDLLVVKFMGGYATRPIHLFGGMGLLATFLSFLVALYTLYQKWHWGVFVHRNPLILLAVLLFLVGIQNIMLGLLAEIIVRTYHESQSKRIYTVRESVNLNGQRSRFGLS